MPSSQPLANSPHGAAHTPHLPTPLLVALTADTTRGVEARCAMAGFHAVLTKPCDMGKLVQVLGAMQDHGVCQSALLQGKGAAPAVVEA